MNRPDNNSDIRFEIEAFIVFPLFAKKVVHHKKNIPEITQKWEIINLILNAEKKYPEGINFRVDQFSRENFQNVFLIFVRIIFLQRNLLQIFHKN